MSRTYIPEAVRQRVSETAKYRCGYCQVQQAVVGMCLHIDHIVPLAADGSSDEGNLWLACPMCNYYKGAQTHALDPETNTQVPLFNPRLQLWEEHFSWSEDGTHVIGLTSTGRATVLALKLNNPFMVHARRRWVRAGWHPPAD